MKSKPTLLAWYCWFLLLAKSHSGRNWRLSLLSHPKEILGSVLCYPSYINLRLSPGDLIPFLSDIRSAFPILIFNWSGVQCFV